MTKLHPGAVLAGRYRIVRILGQGGMSTVFLADDMKLAGKQWAVKEQRLGLREAGLFAAEATIMAKLRHDCLPQIVDYYAPGEDGVCYVVMDYIAGQTLNALFEQAGRRMAAEQVASYGMQLCELFRYLHGRPEPVIYRDLKPSNVMIDELGKVKLIDFGIARSYKADREEDTVRLGTFGFAAPEQFEGRQSDGRTDLYTLGAMMFYLLSGGEYYAVSRRRAAQLGPHVTEPLAAIVDTLLQTEPQRRFQRAEDVLLELERLLGGRGADEAVFSAVEEEGAFPMKRAAERRQPSSGVPVVPRLIAFASLYPGAGATFASIAAAKALAARGIECAVLECPRARPELYALLFGERRAPEKYRYYSDSEAGAELQRGDTGTEWNDGGVSWYTLPPDGRDMAEWSAERRIRLFYRMRKPFIIADAGTALAEPDADTLLDDADELVVVVDPLLHKWCGPQAETALQRTLDMGRATGKPVYWLANRAIRSPGFAEWVKLLPEKPVCCLPELGFAAIAEASWNGELVHDRPEAKRSLSKAISPLVDGWVKEQGRSAAGRNIRTLFGKAW